MELRHLRYFVAVAEELHFRRAAERLHVAQPAVGEQIRKLEAELGIQLFDRTPRGVVLTDAGAAFLVEARRVLRQAEAACRAARDAVGRSTMRLRMGCLADTLPPAVPRALRHVATSLPAVEVHLESGPGRSIAGDVHAGRLDAAITALPTPTTGLRALPLGDERMVVALPGVRPHSGDGEIAIARLAPERIVVLPEDANPAFRNALAALCHAEGLAPTFVEVAEARVEDALLAAAAGTGPAVLPASVSQRYATPGVGVVPVADNRARFRMAALSRPDDGSVATAAFLRALECATRTPRATPSRPLVAVSG